MVTIAICAVLIVGVRILVHRWFSVERVSPVWAVAGSIAAIGVSVPLSVMLNVIAPTAIASVVAAAFLCERFSSFGSAAAR